MEIDKKRVLWILEAVLALIIIIVAGIWLVHQIGGAREDKAMLSKMEALQDAKKRGATAGAPRNDAATGTDSRILPDYTEIYQLNDDMIGWLTIEDTVIDYPVMQTPENEDYYIDKDFFNEKNKNGSLIMDTDSRVGTGTLAADYKDGTVPGTNLIIHGHTMQSGNMFGDLQSYKKEDYGLSHNRICFDSIYEKREYELISAFYSQVFYEDEDVFKFYDFFQADTEDEFNEWYGNIKELALYDTGATAEYGDEFITLTCCSYQVEDGRFVVVGKRIK